jgi:hypothetical protein
MAYNLKINPFNKLILSIDNYEPAGALRLRRTLIRLVTFETYFTVTQRWQEYFMTRLYKMHILFIYYVF